MRRPSARAWVSLAVAFGVGSLYLWIARAAGEPFYWKRDLGGYYDYLSRGILSGHLYLPITPSPELLALPNPWDPKVDEALTMHDMALVNRRYYMYRGAAPAVPPFPPWPQVSGT